ncbi:MAG TPA: uroporphyrinogen-III synthase [Gaiellaceae bacterium]|nr:uroporphyrinogen-III synthase [Gaiellaceae bacterium]
MRILLTGTRAEPLLARLEALGHEVLHEPLVRTEPVGDGPVDVSGYDWVVVTSVTGARELRQRMRGRPARVAAIGAATAEAMGGADLVPRVSSQEGLLAELPRPAGRVLFAGAEGARRLLVDALGADFVALYRTHELRPALPEADLAVLQSASAARALGAIGATIPAVSIGPQTTRAAEAAGVRIVAEARSHDVEGLVEACSSLS